MNNETYLGDGLYASICEWDDMQIKLRAPREESDHEVYLGPHELRELHRFVERNFKLKIIIEKQKEQ